MKSKKEQTQISQTVDLDAEYYRKNSTLQRGLADELLSDYRFEEDAAVLDVGCGDGRITAEIAARVPEGKVVGVDASESMINLAKASFPNLAFQLGKAEEVSFREPFDTIVSFSCLHWVRDPKKALRRMCDLLRPGDDLLILTYPKESLYYEFLEQALEHFPKYRHLSAYRTMLTTAEYENVLKENGLEILQLKARNLIASYADKEDVKDYIRGWLTTYVPLPQELHEAYLSLAAEKCVAYSVQMQNGMINLPYRPLTMIGKKS